MLDFLRLAFRSLLRNRRRSAVTLAAVMVGVGVVVFANGFVDGLIQMMVKSMLENRLGAVEIHARGYLQSSEASPLKLDIPDAEAVMAKVRAVPGVVAVTPRIRFGALVSNGRISSIVMGEAVDPARETQVCPGRGGEIEAASGTFVTSAKPHGGVIGAELARSLEVKAGDTVTISASGREGAVNALDLEIAGVTRGAGSIMESKRVIVVPLAYAQDLVQMNGRVTELAVRVDEIGRIPAVADAIKRTVPELEVSTWDEVMPFLRDAVNRMHIVLGGVTGVLFFIVVFGVINTMLMNVYERVREIGTMLALGATRAQVLALFLCEALAIGVVGGTVGASLGWALVLALHRHGIVMTPPGAAFQQIIRPVPSLPLALIAIGVAVLGALVAAAYPSRKASQMNPVDALRAL